VIILETIAEWIIELYGVAMFAGSLAIVMD